MWVQPGCNPALDLSWHDESEARRCLEEVEGSAAWADPPAPSVGQPEPAKEAARCQVEGCAETLPTHCRYYSRFKICKTHSIAPQVTIAGAALRFCQQCGRFHELSKFQDGNKSCRDALARHNARRQRRKEGLRASRVGTAHAAGALYRVHSSAELNSPMARPMQPRNQQHAAGAAGSAAGVRRVLSCPGLAEAAMPQLQGGGAGQATASSAQPLSMPSPAQLQGCGAEAAAAMATPFASMAALPFEAGAAPVASGMGMNAVAYRGCTHRRASSLPALLQPPQPLHAGGWGYQADAANTFNPAPLHAPAEGLYAGPSPYPSPGLARQGELQQAMLQPQSLLAGSSLGTATAPAAGPWQPAAWERLGTPASSMPASPLAPASPASGNGAAGVEGRPPHAAGSARCRKLAKFETDLERVSFKLFQAPSTQLAPHVLQGVIKLMLEDPTFAERVAPTPAPQRPATSPPADQAAPRHPPMVAQPALDEASATFACPMLGACNWRAER